MKTTLNGINVVAGVVDVQPSAARPLATCIAALFSVALGTSVGLTVPVGTPYEYSAAIAAPSASHTVDSGPLAATF
jgi:hypothetical protein